MLNEEECNEWGRQQRRRKRTFHFGLFVLVFNEKFSFFTPCVLYTSCPFINSFFLFRTSNLWRNKNKNKTKNRVSKANFCCLFSFGRFISFHFIDLFFFTIFLLSFFEKKIVENIFFCFETFESICLLFVDFFHESRSSKAQKSTKTKTKNRKKIFEFIVVVVVIFKSKRNSLNLVNLDLNSNKGQNLYTLFCFVLKSLKIKLVSQIECNHL